MTKVGERRSRVSARESAETASPVAQQAAHRDDDDDTPKSWRWVWLTLGVIALGLITVVLLGGFDRGPSDQGPAAGAIPSTYNANRAYGYLLQLCEIGPRPSGSPGMARQQQLLQDHFATQGATVSMQTFDIRHPNDGSAVPMGNLIASWHPNRPKRFLLCAHYDTRPFPDRDRRNPTGTFLGANDGASGTAALMELAHQMNDLPPNVGVDIVLFDGEEFVWKQGRDDYFLGSKFFAEKYKSTRRAIPYRAGILLDMVGDKELKIYFERNSLRYARDLARSIWRTADSLGVRAFIPRSRHDIDDDHIPLNEIAGIPTVDLIDFDYPRPGIGSPSFWHTEQDIPENCSGESLAAVVWVVDQWLKQQN